MEPNRGQKERNLSSEGIDLARIALFTVTAHEEILRNVLYCSMD
jgi:hypothetical protein